MTGTAQLEIPSLENGDRMDRFEFHRRAMLRPDLRGAELIEGVVYIAMPTNVGRHGVPQNLINMWLAVYAAGNPGVQASGPGSVFLDTVNEPEPDALLYRKGAIEREDGWLEGAPDLVVEIANSSVSRDLHQKKEAYRRNGVQEYIVWRVADGMIDWFALQDGEYVLLEPDPDGIIESREFPGLRLNVPAALALDRRGILAALDAR